MEAIIIERLDYIKTELLKRGFTSVIIDGVTCLKKEDLYIDIVGILPFESIVIGYAIGEEAAKKGYFEDGELFNITLPPEEMIEEILAEIETAA